VSAAEAERQVCDDRAALINAGFNVTDFAYPYGASNETVQATVKKCGYETARSIGGVGGCAGCPNGETIPPANPYATRTRASIKTDKTLADLQADVTAAEQSGGGWVQFVIHHVCEGASCPTYSISPSILAAFLDWLAPRAANGTVVRTVRAALHGSGPPPPPPSDTEPPRTSIACSPRGCSGWNNGPVTVNLTSVDDASGVAEIRYTIDGSEPTRTHGFSCGENPCSFVLSGSATVKYRAWDMEGNAEATRAQAIGIDTSSPTVQMVSPPDRSIVRGTVTVQATAADGAGIASVSFYVNGRLIGRSAAAPYQAQWDSDRDGTGIHEIHAEAVDLAGNAGSSRSVMVYECDDAGGSSSDGNGNGVPDSCEKPPFRFLRGDCNGDGRTGGEVTDPVFLLQFNFAGGGPPPCLAACDVNGDGRVEGEVSDAIYLLAYSFTGGPMPPEPFPACGESALMTDTFLGCKDPPDSCSPPPPPDTAPPATVIACDSGGCSAWSNGPVTVTLTAEDEGSGVAEIRYTTDGSEPARTRGFGCDGDHCSFLVSSSATIRYRSWDLAGNAEATRTQAIQIDTQSPEVQVTSPGNLSVVLGTITVKANAEDNAAIAEVSFYVDGKLIGKSSAAPYQTQWDSARDGIGTHRLQAEARDLAGNTATSGSVTVVGGGL